MAIVRLDKVLSAYNGNLESIVFDKDVTNGIFVCLGDLVEGERELHKAIFPEAIVASATSASVVLHSTPEIMYDPRKSSLSKFVLEAGHVGRGYHLAEGDVITVTDDLIDKSVLATKNAIEPAVGKYVILGKDGKLRVAVNDKDAGYNFISGKIIEQDVLGHDHQKAWVIKIVNKLPVGA